MRCSSRPSPCLVSVAGSSKWQGHPGNPGRPVQRLAADERGDEPGARRRRRGRAGHRRGDFSSHRSTRLRGAHRVSLGQRQPTDSQLLSLHSPHLSHRDAGHRLLPDAQRLRDDLAGPRSRGHSLHLSSGSGAARLARLGDTGVRCSCRALARCSPSVLVPAGQAHFQ